MKNDLNKNLCNDKLNIFFTNFETNEFCLIKPAKPHDDIASKTIPIMQIIEDTVKDVFESK
jgi:hypothetical protein